MAAEYLARMGERIRARREELGLTQQQVANRLPGEVSNARISLWERGQHRPRDDYLEQLAEVLQVDVAYFMAAEPEKETTPEPLANTKPADIAEALSELRDLLRRLARGSDEKLGSATEALQAIAERVDAIYDLNSRVLNELAERQQLIIRLLGGGDGGEAQDVEQPQDPQFPGDQRSADSDERADEG